MAKKEMKPKLESHITYGIHAVSALLESTHRTIHQLYIQQDRQDKRIQDIEQLALQAGIKLYRTSAKALQNQFGILQHQGVIAVGEPPRARSGSELLEFIPALSHDAFILMLDEVTDPHNLGACLRSADAFGIDCIVTPKDNAADISPVVMKVASGAAEHVPVFRVTNFSRTIKALQALGVWVYGACAETTQTIHQVNLTGPVALVMGAEGKGLRRLTRESCDGLFRLPMVGHVSSLNVSVATGISCYEAFRQRSKDNA